MPVNSDKPKNWKKDIARSVDLYNDWFIKFAPQAYRSARAEATVAVENALKLTKNLTDLSPRYCEKIRLSFRCFGCPPHRLSLATDLLVCLAYRLGSCSAWRSWK